jgi:hypothetical protein
MPASCTAGAIPRTHAYSCYTNLFGAPEAFSYTPTELGRFQCGYPRLMAHWQAVLSGSHFLEVHYEPVVEDVEAQVRRMLNFLSLPWDEALLRFHETERQVRMASAQADLWLLGRAMTQALAELQPLLAALGVKDAGGTQRHANGLGFSQVNPIARKPILSIGHTT